MRQGLIAEELGVNKQRVRQLIIKLHAFGHVRFADPTRPSWLVMKADDRTPFLSRDAERVLSVLPDDYATDVKKICIVARMSVSKVKGFLEELIFQSLVKVVQGLDSSTTYWITSAGLEHPQRASDGNRARAPRLPVAVRPRSRRAVDYSRQWITADQGCDGATRDPPSINERAVPVSKAQAADRKDQQ